MREQIYLGHVRSHYVPKNKLQKAISEYIDTLDGLAFPEGELPEMKKQINEKINELNKIHKRSTPVSHYWHKSVYNGRTFYYLHHVQSIDFVFMSGKLKL